MATPSRVYPGTSDNMEMGVSSVSYRGGHSSSMTQEEMESYRNRMTLQDARWIGVRKKVPGMSSIPKMKTRSKSLTDQEGASIDPYQKHLGELRLFVRQHFHQKECAKFIPKPGQTTGPRVVKKIKELKCHCGEVLMEHAGMQGPFQHFSSAEMMMEYLVPKELNSIIRKDKLNDAPPEKLPDIEWKAENIRSTATCSYGKVNFENVEHAGGKKPAKYIRIADDDSVDDLVDLMVNYWKIMEPERPNLVISVVGGAKNFKLDGRMRDTFSTGLIKAAKTTSAWLISSGFNMGVMKAVGQAVRQGQSFCWDNDRMAHVLRCIGIAPWGYVKKRKDLESLEGQGKFNANYRTSNAILHNSAVPLNPDHTHFIFVDDGYRIRYGGVAGIRAKLEQKISQPKADGGLGIPVVLVIVEGGTDSINDAQKSLEHNIPVVVCAGTGRAADILAYAYTHTKTGSGGVRNMKDKHLCKLMDKIYDAYGKGWKEDEQQKKTEDIAASVQVCCQNPEMLTVFHMNKHEDLDLSILSVLLKAKKGADEAQRIGQLKLALTWDRVDVAQEEIFREDVLWSTGGLDEILTEALLKNKVKFVELILQQGVVMKEYLTVGTLEKLYQENPKHNYLFKVMHRLTGRELLNLENVRLLLVKLLDKFDTMENHYLEETEGEYTKDDKLLRFKRPYKMLLIWALLMNRQVMAKLFWELGEEPVSSALVATRICHTVAKNLPRHESNLKDKFSEYETEFELLATNVLNECHNKDPDKAMMIAERKSPCWNEMTCLQLAAAANDQVFLSSVTCQSSINMIWKHGIIAAIYKVALSIFFPPYIVFGLEILNLGEDKLTAFQKLSTFYSSPLSKFSHGNLMYAGFLVLHSYMVLVAFQPSYISPIEAVCIIWVFSFFIDELHTFIAFPSPTFMSKIRDWYGFLKWLDLFNFILAFIGFFIHWARPEYYTITKVMYCINSIIFFLRIMKIYITNGQLGPKIFMIQRMFDELRMFIMVLLVFLLAYGVSSQGLLYHIRTPSWVILKDVFYFPYWQLYGEIFLDDIETEAGCLPESVDCRTFHWLVPFLLAAYLLVGNILLLNLLIAIFSHVFETVEKNSIEIWKYQMYFLVMEYENKTALVPPFSLFQHAFLAIRWVIQKTCCKRVRNRQTFSKRHLEYLQLFEKEMMMNYLRQRKAEEMSGIETTVNSLQKRVDELTKLIEDEVIADQQPMGMTTMMYRENTMEMSHGPMNKDPKWPPAQKVVHLQNGEKMEPITEEKKEKVKKNKHKKQKPKNEEVEEINIDTTKMVDDVFDEKLNNMNIPPNISSIQVKPELADKMSRRSNERGLLPAPVFQFPDGSGSDNATETEPSPKKEVDNETKPSKSSMNWFGKQRLSENVDIEPRSPRSSVNWTPKRRTQDNSDDENGLLKSRPQLQQRLSQERMQKYGSSDESDENNSKIFARKLKKKKKKKKKKNLRYVDDTE